MTSEVMTSTAGYWYEDSAVSAVDVLNAPAAVPDGRERSAAPCA
ncbi:hypothetical protein Q9Q99_16730 [Curtobacterium flaccumfaciens]|nr:hypothetical protein Q9Q99_16730 [Curtobacterium flaccumfaciens]